MNTLELLQKLAQKPKNEVEFALLSLMIGGKIDFIAVQQAYVRYLEELKDKNLCEIIEAETGVLESLMYGRKPRNEQEEISVQRRLYLLNQSKRFRMDSLNAKFGYDEKRAKTYNCVEQLILRR